jgi:hypothetical protein
VGIRNLHTEELSPFALYTKYYEVGHIKDGSKCGTCATDKCIQFWSNILTARDHMEHAGLGERMLQRSLNMLRGCGMEHMA